MRNRTLNELLGTVLTDLVLEKAEEEKDKTTSDKPDSSKKKKKRRSGSKIIDTGAYGTGGRFGGMIEDFQKSRAMSNPGSLMADLGVSSASGNDDLSKVASILEQAIAGNEIMQRAFSSPVEQKTGDQVRIRISPSSSDLTPRVATKYLHLTLIAAENAGVLSLDEGVRFMKLSEVGVPTLIAL